MFHFTRSRCARRRVTTRPPRLRLLGLEGRVAPAVFTVTNLLDGPIIAAGALPGSLRQAIFDANALAGPDDIGFSGVAGTIALAAGELDITESVTITGPGAGALSIDGGGLSRVFKVMPFVIGEKVALSRLTITGGAAPAPGGGGILNVTAALVVDQCLVVNNTTDDDGGGISVAGADPTSLTVTSSVVSGNAATMAFSSGGGINVDGAATIEVVGSKVDDNDSGLHGGGLYLHYLGKLSMSNSTVSGNKSNTVAAIPGKFFGAGGGGIYLGASSAIIVNGTISGNSTTSKGLDSPGGGISVVGSTLLLHNSTVAFNDAGAAAGGGVDATPAYLVNFESSIIGNNAAFFGPDVAGAVTSKFSLISKTDAALVLLPGSAANLLDMDPALGPLADNGGQTKTHALKAGSPAIDKGSNGLAMPFDQRNVPYGRETPAGKPDIGAFEVPPPPVVFVVDEATDVDDGLLGPGKLSLREAIGLANKSVPSDDTIGFSPAVFGAAKVIGLAGGELSITDKVTIVGPGSGLLTLSGKGVTRVIHVSATGSPAVSISGVTIADGATFGGPTSGSPLDDGAGIQHDGGKLTLDGVVVTGNSSAAEGGGIGLGLNGSLTLRNSTVSGNTAGGSGGGVYFLAHGGLVVENSTITGNTANSVAAAYYYGGGGIYFWGALSAGSKITGSTITANLADKAGPGGGIALQSFTGVLPITDSKITANMAGKDGGGISSNGGGTVTLDRCTVADNVAGFTGGGVYSFAGAVTVRNSLVATNTALRGGGILTQSACALLVENSTVSGNKATELLISGRGGGIGMFGFATPGASFTLRNSTVTANSAAGFSGGGIHLTGTSDNPVVIDSSIISGNLHPFNPDPAYKLSPDFYGPSAAAGALGPSVTINYSLIGVANGFVAPTAGVANLTGTELVPLDAKLGPLADNGGTTKTHLLLPGSPALNAGSNPAGLTTDQRSGAFSRTLNLKTDMGAVEVLVPPALFVVDEATDVDDGLTGVGKLSLREAIRLSNENLNLPGTDTITFAPAAFPAGTVVVVVGEMVINESLDIVGPGIANLTLDGGLANRIFKHQQSTTDIALSLSGMTLTKGTAGTPAVAEVGGAFFFDNFGTTTKLDVTLSELAVTKSVASANGAGGYYRGFGGGSITLDKVTFAGNLMDGPGNFYGVGLFVWGTANTMSVTDSVFDGNVGKSTTAGVVHAGAGLGANIAGGKISVTRSTFKGNDASSSGGAVFNNGSGTTWSITDCLFAANKTGVSGGALAAAGSSSYVIRNTTFSGNTAATNGGAIRVFAGTTTDLTVTNSTLTGNAAASGGALNIGSGAVTLESTIVAGNAAPAGPDITGALTSVKTSLIGKTDGSAFPADPSNITGTILAPVDPLLAPLAANGEPTLTHALKAGSPAIDKGSNPAGLAADQRGTTFRRSMSKATDMGAFETQIPPAKVLAVVVNGGDIQRSRVLTIAVSFDQYVNFSGPATGTFELKRVHDGAVVGGFTAKVDNSGPTSVVTLRGFTGSTTEFGSLADGRYILTISGAKLNMLDGNGDGTGGDDYVLVGSPAVAPKLFRLFGDFDGDGDTDVANYGEFRGLFGGSAAMADFEGDGDVDSVDFAQFRGRFGTSV